jgi:5-methylcytosine-specific restriction endonuclease McrA
MAVDASLRDLVRMRAGGRCEYCRIHQDDDPFLKFHIEHIVARQHGGPTAEANLALSCHHCNLHKGPNLSGIDPSTGQVVPLFNPRQDPWNQHFAWRGVALIGLTPTGRATIRVLAMNARERLDLRSFAKNGV